LHDLSPDVKLCLFRVAQEALSNVVKHSGASQAELQLVGANGQKSITMTVSDDGKGFDPDKVETDSLGIISMRERQVGGELRILSRRPYNWSVLHVSKDENRVNVTVCQPKLP